MTATKKDRLTLHIYHSVALTREQRYALADGTAIQVVGVSIPVWAYRDVTSEPAMELFCKYTLTNQPGPTAVVPFGEGYQVNIPQLPKGYEPPVRPTDDQWRDLTEKERERWYAKYQPPPTGKNLRDLADRGSAYLRFAFTKRMRRNNRPVSLYHIVEIQDSEELLSTLSDSV